ncbi:sulfotransferase [Sphingomonas qomolangmaensis]|uniref:Sulfotransferase n=1 Tax=Sphingomonas qomolangmaensis TaxID=2918765 RepID=A0ABY5L670_9SPHN|nr:sulfotransferase [Sphingomonas qomolangmaensis]UUL82450.1 sulfotransferase [Sphingomonas qomolangmaensis]
MSHADPPIDRLRQAVLDSAALQARLVAIDDRDAFVAALGELAGSLGIAFDHDAAVDAVRPDPVGLARFAPSRFTQIAWPVGDWLPTAIVPGPEGAGVEWLHFGDSPLTAPFFEDSLRAARRRPFNRWLRVRTPLVTLADGAPGGALAPPSGLVFHLSRCGSTLVAQMLAASPRHVVVSEAPPFDALVQLLERQPAISLAQRVLLVRAMAAALGRDRFGNRRHYFLKLDSWHPLALPLLRHAFPDTPWVFLYRDPVEILVSHQRMPGSQTVPGMMGNLFGMPDGHLLGAAVYTARVLARICDAVLAYHALGGGALIAYGDLPEAVPTRILPHFGVTLDPDEQAAMAAAALRDAKSPAARFSNDAAAKQCEASAAIRSAATKYLDNKIAHLDRLRLEAGV